MDDLIEALQIFRKYANLRYPTCCLHDTLYICGVQPKQVSVEDREKLEKLGFHVTNEYNDDGTFVSYRFGSA